MGLMEQALAKATEAKRLAAIAEQEYIQERKQAIIAEAKDWFVKTFGIEPSEAHAGNSGNAFYVNCLVDDVWLQYQNYFTSLATVGVCFLISGVDSSWVNERAKNYKRITDKTSLGEALLNAGFYLNRQ